MSAELPKDNTLFHLEEQYETAAWDATLVSLSKIWNEDTYNLRAKEIPYSIQLLAQTAFKDVSEVYSLAATFSRSESADEFKYTGLIVNNPYRHIDEKHRFTPSPSFSILHALKFDKDPIIIDIANSVKFERFQTDISTLALYNKAKLRSALDNPVALAESIGNLHQENAFYLGMWDADRSLGLPKD